MKRSESNAKLYEEGLEWQLRHKTPRVVLKKEWRGPDYFGRGRLAGHEMLLSGYDPRENRHAIQTAQAEATEAYEQATRVAAMYRAEGNVVTKRTFEQMELEPCATCDLIIYCRDNEMTCSAFRAYVTEAGGKNAAFKARVPDKTWSDSFREE